MNTHSFLKNKGHASQWSFWIIRVALIAGLILSILSWLELCVEHCSANHDYRLFGFPFAVIGMTFFSGLIAVHCLVRFYPILSKLFGWLIATAFGAEVMFILIQKYQIGQWCPVCLGIAASIGVAALVLLASYILKFKVAVQHHNQGEIMQKIKQGLISFSFIILGFLMAFVGIHKPNYAEAGVSDIKEQIVFGDKNSPIQLFFITDWFCPSCKKIEPTIEKLYPDIKSKVAFYFIDFPIHRNSLNFTPYNLSFMVNDKAHYFRARDALNALSDKNESPNDQDVAAVAKKEKVNFKELTFLEVKAGIDFFDKIAEKYDIRATPTMIITNNKNDKVVKLEGRDEINEEKILEAIEKVSASSHESK